jgi:hypothetical protein
VIPRKQRSAEADWRDVLAASYAAPDADRATRLVERAVERVGAAGSGLAYAWSGGKDSQALRVVAEAAGVPDCVLVISDLE